MNMRPCIASLEQGWPLVADHGLHTAEGRRVMSFTFRLVVGGFVVLAGSTGAYAQFRARPAFVITPPQMNQQMNQQMTTSMKGPSISPALVIFPNPFRLAHLQRHSHFHAMNPYASRYNP